MCCIFYINVICYASISTSSDNINIYKDNLYVLMSFEMNKTGAV